MDAISRSSGLPVAALAGAYARLVAASRLPGEDAASAAVRARIVKAMTRRADMVAGSGRFTTDFMEAGRGRWVAKEGSEGVYAVGVRADSPRGKAFGLAFKIEDGSTRGRDAIALAAIDRLGALPAEVRRALAAFGEPVIRSAAGAEVGRIEAHLPPGGAGRSRAAKKR